MTTTPPFALPLTVKHVSLCGNKVASQVLEAVDLLCFTFYNETARANYIVTAVNAHAGLVEALEEAQDMLHEWGHLVTEYPAGKIAMEEDLDRDLAKLDAALAAAKQKEPT